MKNREFRFFSCSLLFFCWALNEALAASVHTNSPSEIARGGASIAVADDIGAFYSNPAGLSRFLNERQMGISARFMERMKDIGFVGGLIDAKTEDPLAWGLLVNVARTRQEKFQDYIFGSSLNFRNLLLFGLQTKLSHFNRWGSSKDFVLFSMSPGVLGFLGDHIAFGAKFENLVRSKSRSDVAPYVLGLGASFNHEVFRIAGDFERSLSQSSSLYKFGAEWATFDWLSLRAGYQHRRPDEARNENFLSGGFGWNWTRNTSFMFAYMDQLKSNYYILSSALNLRF